jgi:hypothetical protein
MKPAITDRDPGDETLFDPKSTMPPKCACGSTRKNLCVWAANRHHFGIDSKQPRTCLLRYDPANGEIPF